MDSIARSDMFFFVTTIVVVLIAFALLVIAFYIFKIVREFRKISQTLRELSEAASEKGKLLLENSDETKKQFGKVASKIAPVVMAVGASMIGSMFNKSGRSKK